MTAVPNTAWGRITTTPNTVWGKITARYITQANTDWGKYKPNAYSLIRKTARR